MTDMRDEDDDYETELAEWEASRPVPRSSATADMLARQQRQDRFEARVAREVASGWSIKYQSSSEAVLEKVTPPNHLMHGVLTVFTGGLWFVVWLVIALRGGKSETKTISAH